ncbi:unnamed protein product [Cuscuta epithymum]|uniref:Uncharacterized protein n=1 Tax=Cuscuta epithymum TaxID=186058 RepID=A0AAV0DEK4_9ASTE|nr:unnamed protein product [Cuscuta epithymum]
MKSVILLKEVKVKQPPLLLEHSPRKNTNFEWDLVTLDRDLPLNELSISGTLFQIDVEKSDLCDQSLVLRSEIDSSLSHLNDFLPNFLISLSHHMRTRSQTREEP